MGFGRKVGRIWLVMRNRHWVSNQESTQEQLQQNRMGWVLDKLFDKNQANTQKWLTFVFGLTGWEPVFVFFFFLHYARLLCPPLTPWVCSNSCPLSQWCYLTISSSAASFSFCFQSFLASGSFLISQLFTSGGQSIGASPRSLGNQYLEGNDLGYITRDI